jgi:hypothetical protein
VEFASLFQAVRDPTFSGPTSNPGLERRPILQSRHLIAWWRDEAVAYPTLRSIALKYFTLCVSVTPVDRYFSELKALVRENQAGELAATLETRAMLAFGRRTVEMVVDDKAGREVVLPPVLNDEPLDLTAQDALVQDVDQPVNDEEEDVESGDEREGGCGRDVDE